MPDLPFIESLNGNFICGGEVFRFIGCNMYELANVDLNVAEAMLRNAADEGFKVVRFWAFEPTCKNKLKEICDISGQLNLRLIPVLADTRGYLQNYKIDSQWYKEGYRKNYLGYIKDMGNCFKNRSEILLWELINEPFTDSLNDICCFAEEASKTLKQSSPDHLISVGTIGGIGDKFGNFFSRFNESNFEKLYSINSLDAVSLHDYSFNSTIFERLDILYRLQGKYKAANFLNALDKITNYLPLSIDKFTILNFRKTYDFPLTLRNIWRYFNSRNIASARRLNKPVYIGETGFKKNMNEQRVKILGQELKKYFNEGISGVLLWSFEAQGKSLDGHDYGFNSEDGFDEVIKNFSLHSKKSIS